MTLIKPKIPGSEVISVTTYLPILNQESVGENYTGISRVFSDSVIE
jgi:hypothetical protein